MRRFFDEITGLFSIVAEVILGDESTLTPTFLISRVHKNPKNVVLSCVTKFC